jgi:PST family polysaccharide transporter
VAFIVGCIAIFVYKPSDIVSQTLIALLLLGYIFQAVDVIDYFFQAKVLSKYVVFARSIAFVAASILKIYFIIFQYSLIYFAIASLVEIILGALFMYLVYKQLGLGLSDWEMNRSVSKKLLRDSWPLMLSAFFITIYMIFDQVMIESFLDMQSVGLYSVAVRLAEAWYFVPTIIISTVMPYFVNLKETNTDMYNYRLRQINTLMVWMSIMVGIIFTFFGEYIIILMFGESYKDAYIPLSLSIWAGIFVSVGLSSSLWVISENLQIYRLIGTMISVGLNVLGNYILIPIYGISGAAIATLITQGIGLWVIPLFFKPMRQFTIMSITSILPIYLLKGKK